MELNVVVMPMAPSVALVLPIENMLHHNRLSFMLYDYFDIVASANQALSQNKEYFGISCGIFCFILLL